MTDKFKGTSLYTLACGLLASSFAVGAAQAQQAIVVGSGTTDTTQKTVGGMDSVTVQADGVLATTTNPAINWSGSSTNLRITNAGTIRSTANDGRAINAGGGNNGRTLTLVNAAGGVIESQNDAIRINVAPTAGTIRIDNYGTIRTLVSGQALDFDATTGGATVLINNYQGGELRGFGQDAIRPGQGAVVTNSGLIMSDGPANNSFDAIDWQQKSGTVVNTASGTISGLRHGITSDINVDVTNAGTIIGRNGSGVGSDGGGTVTNTGTITGQWDGVATNGDGDGVDLDFAGTIVNSGTIQGLSATGVDSGGRPNSAEGVAMGGGSITNNAGATIFGAGNAILVNHDTNPGGVADAATTILNAGTIRAGSGRAISLVGDFADSITNSGAISGGTLGAIDMGGGNDTLVLSTGSVITGTVDGGAGSDVVRLTGSGTGSFAGAVNFETLEVATGNWTVTAPAAYSAGVAVAAPASLAGNTASLTGAIANAGTLVFNQTADGTLAATITGSGLLTKTGAGALTVGDQEGFTGRVAVDAGRLVLAGTLPAATTVNNGATLAGVGTVGALAIASGGTVAPGNSPGTITVTGPFSQAAGSTYLAETTATGVSDRIVVGGAATIANGAVLRVTQDGGAYTIGTRYTLLTAAGGVSGSYTLQQTADANTELRLVQSANAVAVDVARSPASLRGLATTSNQAAVVAPFSTLGAANAAYAALTLIPDQAIVQGSLDQLSGEVHATVRTTMLRAAQSGEDVARTRLLAPQGGSGVWLQMTGQRANDDADATSTAARRHGWGAFGGLEASVGTGARLGLAGGYTQTDLTLKRGLGSADVETWQALAYAGGTFGPIALRGSVGYAWSTNEVSRQIAFPGFAAAATARYDGSVLHGFAEAGIPIPALGGTIEPFAGIEAYRVQTDDFAESPSAIALAGRDRKETFALTTLGLRTETPITQGLSARARIGWQRALDDRRPISALRFVAGGPEFAVAGVPLSRDAALLGLDLNLQPSERLQLAAGYAGNLDDAGSDNRFRVSAVLGF